MPDQSKRPQIKLKEGVLKVDCVTNAPMVEINRTRDNVARTSTHTQYLPRLTSTRPGGQRTSSSDWQKSSPKVILVRPRGQSTRSTGWLKHHPNARCRRPTGNATPSTSSPTGLREETSLEDEKDYALMLHLLQMLRVFVKYRRMFFSCETEELALSSGALTHLGSRSSGNRPVP